MIEKLPKSAQTTFNQYLNLPLNGKKFPCPYYINIKKLRQRMGLRVLIGKGTPEEIIRESLIYEKLRGVDFNKMSIGEIREFMVKRHIGIDCSGFVVHILDSWLMSIGKKHLWHYLRFPKQSIYRRIARFLRPVENISANTLTNDQNTIQIKNLNNIQCGDLIRSCMKKRSKSLENFYHVMLISETNKSDGKIKLFKYIHATRQYEKEHGVREGEVLVSDPKQSLYKQKWTDTLEGKNWTYNDVCSNPDYSQVRRLKNVPVNK